MSLTYRVAEELSDDDINLLRHFALKVESHMTDETFDQQLPHAFPDTPMETWKATKSRAAWLAAFKPIPYDCCINSCCCYVGQYETDKHCSFCNEPRFNAAGRPRKRFTYVPIIPRLVAMFRNPDLVNTMKYRHQYTHTPGRMTDVMDSENYRRLCDTNVRVNGKDYPHKYFQHLFDIALGLSTDGFAPFRRRKQTCWPIILFNYNLPPEIRFLIENILCIGVVPGPKKPKDWDSFFWPAMEELLRLAIGVRAFNSLSKSLFSLRAHLIIAFGDIPAVSMIMRMKGHNGLAPCRMCNIKALRIPKSSNKTHYVPLDRSRHPSVRSSESTIKSYNPANLPLRTHDEFISQAHEVDMATTKAQEEHLAKSYGIKGTPILSYIHSLSFPKSFPYDFMHLVFENVIKNLLDLWTLDTCKGLDEGAGSYRLGPKVAEAVGMATAQSGSTIPGAFGARPADIHSDRSQYTADMYSFWMQYIGPVVLAKRFKRDIYHGHFVDLVKLTSICLQFEYTDEDIRTVRRGFENWVRDYEKSDLSFYNAPATFY